MFFYVSEMMTENYYACPGLQEREDATTLTISESQQHIEPSISHRSKRLKFVESSTGKLKLMDSPHRMGDLRPAEQRPLLSLESSNILL